MALTKRHRHWGLTLIELLIVLVITGLLVSIAAPSWQGFYVDGVVHEARLVLTRLGEPGNADYGHLSASLDFAGSGPRQSALSRERQRLMVSTLIL